MAARRVLPLLVLAAAVVPGLAAAHGGVGLGLGVVVPVVPAAPAPAVVYLPAPGPVGYLRTEVDPPTAWVLVDGYRIAAAHEISGARLAALPVGRHRLDLVAPGFLPHTAVLVIGPNQTTEVRVRLVPIPPAPVLPPVDR